MSTFNVDVTKKKILKHGDTGKATAEWHSFTNRVPKWDNVATVEGLKSPSFICRTEL